MLGQDFRHRLGMVLSQSGSKMIVQSLLVQGVPFVAKDYWRWLVGWFWVGMVVEQC